VACLLYRRNMLTDDPRKLGIPHEKWRPSQRDAINKASIMHSNGGGVLVIEAPTGVGKSGIPTGLAGSSEFGGTDEDVLVLVHNHGLLKQYRDEYGFDIIMGKQEYPCILESKVDNWKATYGITPTVADCHFPNNEMCPVGNRCPYTLARNTALQSNRMACTYRYAGLSEQVRQRSGIIVMDEAHDCYEELLAMSQLVIDESVLAEHKFPKFPLIDFGVGGKGDLLDGQNRAIVLDWLAKCMSKISVTDLFSMVTPSGAKNQRLFEKLSGAIKLLISDQILFYRCSTPQESFDWRFDKRNRPGIQMQIRSVDVSELAKSLMGGKSMTVMMSATIGDPKPLMGQIGITNFQYHNYPHPTPKENRPVFDLGMPGLTKRNIDDRPSLYKEQANRIADFIESLDPSWRGIVLTTSNYKITQLRRFLKERLPSRVIEPTETNSSGQLASFINDSKASRIAVGTIQMWGTGISLYGNVARFSVVAGVPYANPGDRFDQIRMSSAEGKRYAFWNAHCAVVQATGRVSRGEKNDDGSFMLNVGAIADGSATSPMAKGSYPGWYKESIVGWKKK
jgi:Rad3-related DNA helicase